MSGAMAALTQKCWSMNEDGRRLGAFDLRLDLGQTSDIIRISGATPWI